ncbi:hypothetical protein NEUTE1DRAFT_84499 [Neurospora tetrasperma FGSC 2508]|uniref:AAA+ ATPase domain-containing protein n=1 Tax=Neurospora tetrasperma (strain FGSC 2508 / ATCC MYA-4615 / P0657) TaxID=510951 RepID=F8MRM3_NEUT8|nr:uncharacterized protein NEUTE1DRAFT_84499 [Neurospora tetrasperma FGSC 2508]EGO56924.1 hypothetical protein NEUTE1DRAFT_84499 [Neurospora tetrasperma FGSC 2508]EGZ70173.1 ATP-dependent metallopeptidase Hfl [Neurospora tetrasperma FGSC 2509]
MAFHASGLPLTPPRACQTIAAATTELWPSIATTLAVPFGLSTSLKAQQRHSHNSHGSTASSNASRNLASSPAREASSSSALPAFLRTAPLPQPVVSQGLANASPTNIFSEISSMSSRQLAMANPLFRRSFSALMSRPLGTVNTLRSMSTHQPGRIPSFFRSPVHSPLGFTLQARNFGNGGLSHNLLAAREAAANQFPTSAGAQYAFYQALLKANMPAIIIERYQSGRFATNEQVDQIYQQALAMSTGQPYTPANNAVDNNGYHPSGFTASQIHAAGTAAAAQHTGGNMAMVKPIAAGAKTGPLHIVVDESFGSSALRWVKFLMWFTLFTYLSMVVITMVFEGLSSIKRPGGKLEASEVKPENQKARFADVHGCDEAKEELQELIDFLRNPEKYSTLGGKLPKGVLLVGPPGTGKTLLARAVAGEAGVPFFNMSGSEFEEVYVGVGAKRVRDLFAAAKAKAPSITLNQLLTELDGFEQNSGVIIIGATNFPESLDKALTRPGRFDRNVVVSLPDVRGRMAILQHHAKRIKAAADVNLEAIASRTSGLSGAELENIVNQAAIHASKLKAQAVTQKDFEWAKDKVIMGAEKRSMVITAKEKEMTAYHEAGHALVGYYAKDSASSLYKVTILPRGQTLGHTAYLPEMDKHSFTVRDYLGMIDRAMGGKVAEEIVYGNELVTSGVSADLDMATRTAWQMVAQLGMSEKLGPVEYLRKYNQLSSETRAMVESEVKRVLDESYERARNLLTSKRNELDYLAKALVEYETLDKKEVERVIRGEKLKDRISVPPGPMAIPKPSDTLEPGLPLPPLPGDVPPPGDSGPGPAPPPPVPA